MDGWRSGGMRKFGNMNCGFGGGRRMIRSVADGGAARLRARRLGNELSDFSRGGDRRERCRNVTGTGIRVRGSIAVQR